MSGPCPVLGFYVRATLFERTTNAEAQTLLDSLLALLEAHGLSAGGGGDRILELAVSRDGAQATYADRELVSGWASGWRHLADFSVSDMVDLDR